MEDKASAARLNEKNMLQTIQMELQQGYNLSPVEAQVLAQYVQQLIDAQTGLARQPGQIIYQAIAVDEPAGKALKDCRKVAVQLTLSSAEDMQAWATQDMATLRRVRVHRLVYEALAQGGALSQEDLACVLGCSLKSIKRIFAYYRQQDQPLPSRGEVQDMGRGVSHKIPVIRKYVQDLSFSQISQHLHNHGLRSMARYLRHFALVMILQERELTPAQMQSVMGISENLIQQYRDLYAELNCPPYERTLERLKQSVLHVPTTPSANVSSPTPALSSVAEKGGL
jgi:hypothetical protein